MSEYTDLIARLREFAIWIAPQSPRELVVSEAADAIQALQAENERLYGIAVMHELAIRERERERALADQLAEALRIVNEDHAWDLCVPLVLNDYKEARHE